MLISLILNGAITRRPSHVFPPQFLRWQKNCHRTYAADVSVWDKLAKDQVCHKGNARPKKKTAHISTCPTERSPFVIY